MSGCSKMRFETRGDANREIRRIKTENRFHSGKAGAKRKSNRKMSAYECPDCGGWHLTTLPKAMQKRIHNKPGWKKAEERKAKRLVNLTSEVRNG